MIHELPLLQRVLKRLFDFLLAAIGLLLTGWLILLAWIIAWLDTGQNGFFTQERIGLHGRPFRIVKIRTMKPVSGYASVVTTATDPRITRIGGLLRRTKVDELPQLFNVLIGDMSLVGPRPEVADYIDLLDDEERMILSVRPGLTGPATLKYHDEAVVLAQVADPERYNREVLYPDKVRLNQKYIQQFSLVADFIYIWKTAAQTLFPRLRDRSRD